MSPSFLPPRGSDTYKNKNELVFTGLSKVRPELVTRCWYSLTQLAILLSLTLAPHWTPRTTPLTSPAPITLSLQPLLLPAPLPACDRKDTRKDTDLSATYPSVLHLLVAWFQVSVWVAARFLSPALSTSTMTNFLPDICTWHLQLTSSPTQLLMLNPECHPCSLCSHPPPPWNFCPSTYSSDVRGHFWFLFLSFTTSSPSRNPLVLLPDQSLRLSISQHPLP